MIIICDKDTEPPEIPEIETPDDFREFVFMDLPRLLENGVKNATYWLRPNAAKVFAMEDGYSIAFFDVSIDIEKT